MSVTTFAKRLFGLEKGGKFKEWSITVGYDISDANFNDYLITIAHGGLGGKLTYKFEKVTAGKQGRTVEEQAVMQAQARIKKQIDKGYRESTEELTDLPLLAMLAADFKKQGHRIKFPAMASVKYDGLRCLVEKKDGVAVMKTRTNQPYDIPHLQDVLNTAMANLDVWDGEIYLHGYELEDIHSAATRTDTQGEIDKVKRKIEKHGPDYRPAPKKGVIQPTLAEELEHAELIHYIRPRLQFHLFDAASDRNELETSPFVVREGLMVAIAVDLSAREREFVKVTVYHQVNSLEELEAYHDQCVDLGYEGAMVRNLTGVYESGKRSADLQKYKRMITAEFKILDVVADKDGNAVFVLLNDVNSNQYNCVMGDMDQRRLFILHKDDQIGKFMSVDYQKRYKKTLLPQFPAGKRIREGSVVNGEFVPSE